MESLSGIVYVSEANKRFDKESLEVLVKKASAKNSKYGITGFLFHKKNHFLQYIEGNNKQVSTLVGLIHKDPDHQVKLVNMLPNMISKKFHSWNMVLIKDTVTMELVLMDYLIAISNKSGIISKEQHENIWRMIDKITRAQLVRLTV